MREMRLWEKGRTTATSPDLADSSWDGPSLSFFRLRLGHVYLGFNELMAFRLREDGIRHAYYIV